MSYTVWLRAIQRLARGSKLRSYSMNGIRMVFSTSRQCNQNNQRECVRPQQADHNGVTFRLAVEKQELHKVSYFLLLGKRFLHNFYCLHRAPVTHSTGPIVWVPYRLLYIAPYHTARPFKKSNIRLRKPIIFFKLVKTTASVIYFLK